MPLYEYECAKCGERFEQIEKFSDAPLKKHEGCGGKVKRLLSAPAFQFKGSGWYVTDYARSGKADTSNDKKADKKAEAAESKSKADSDSKPKAESKAESKTESKGTASSDSTSKPAKTADSSKK